MGDKYSNKLEIDTTYGEYLVLEDGFDTVLLTAENYESGVEITLRSVDLENLHEWIGTRI